MRGLVAHLRVVFATLMASGCVLFVHPDEGGEHCAFRGTTACATCLKAKCQASIDACCRDSTCANTSGILGTIDECGDGSPTSCASGLKTQLAGGPAAALRDCVSAQCGNECTAGASTPPEPVEWKCEGARDPITDCASCIYSSCDTQITDCCSDTNCAKFYPDIRKDMGACTTGDAAGCAYMTTKSDSGLDGALRSCIEKKCAARCIGNARPHQNCALASGGTRCYCTNSQTSSGPECSVAKVGGTCAIAAKGCTCGSYQCTGSSSYDCDCSFDGDPAKALRTTCRKSPTSSYGRCCLKLEDQYVSCKCDTLLNSCVGSNEYDIDSCDSTTVIATLRGAGRIVDKCSN
jgi:hypothetical protein